MGLVSSVDDTFYFPVELHVIVSVANSLLSKFQGHTHLYTHRLVQVSCFRYLELSLVHNADLYTDD